MGAVFPLELGSGVRLVRKLGPDEFDDGHRRAIAGLSLDGPRLMVPPGWEAALLGAGEEKAVHCLRDPEGRVFALEVIDERGYLRGRLADGYYLADLRVSGLTEAGEAGSFSRRATGLVRAREFVHGYEWARFQFDPRRRGPLDRLLTGWLQALLTAPMREYRRLYGDVHDRNVMFEVRPLGAPGVPVLVGAALRGPAPR